MSSHIAVAPPVPIARKLGWRQRPVAVEPGARVPGVVASRWHSLHDQLREVSAQTPNDSYLICIALRRMTVRLTVAGRVVHDGIVTPGTMHITPPAEPAACLFRGPYDALHLHLSTDLLTECGRAARGGDDPLASASPAPFRDPTIERLGLALLTADQLGSAFGPIYADCLGTAIASRLLAFRLGAAGAKQSSAAELPKWRLKRALDYIEAHLGEAISLADIAAAAGLSRMYFAAQFRAATGLRPHEYLVRRRIERAQEMLLAPTARVVDVAQQVGFQTQAYFTGVFKRFVGQPPHAWRQMHGRLA
jgi:AraC family transcriptional regulator